jgi:hypothetical protein
MKSAIKDSRQTFSDQVRVSRNSFNSNGRIYDSNVMIIRNLALSTVSSISWNVTPSYTCTVVLWPFELVSIFSEHLDSKLFFISDASSAINYYSTSK